MEDRVILAHNILVVAMKIDIEVTQDQIKSLMLADNSEELDSIQAQLLAANAKIPAGQMIIH
ncbi:hypothetical protein GCM10023149_21490 [Mucilaginibacter gynuensis]|uniref:Uncharacterized protein n=1 Tax=Mucilaginibacter gynuensis TaxID=1302236 RepID=A0ABP8GCV4_9SPHI